MGYRDGLEAREICIANLQEELAHWRATAGRNEALAERLAVMERALNGERSDHQNTAARGAAERERERVLHRQVIEREQQLLRDDRSNARLKLDAERDRLGASLERAETERACWRQRCERRGDEIAAFDEGPIAARRFYETRIAELQAEVADDDWRARELLRLREALARVTG